MPRASWLLARVFGGLIKNTNEKANTVDSVVGDAEDNIVDHIHHHVQSIEDTQAEHTTKLNQLQADLDLSLQLIYATHTKLDTLQSKVNTIQSKVDYITNTVNEILGAIH